MMSEANWELIVHRLNSISESQTKFEGKLNEIYNKLNKLETISNNIDELKQWRSNVDDVLPLNEMKSVTEWKSKVDEVVSPTQLKEYISELEKLKTFKTKATMVWAVIQGIVFILLFLDKALNIFSR